MKLDIDERHLLRLGHGEEGLETEKDFSRYGRVNYVLEQRLELLKKVVKLQDSLGILEEHNYTCETAAHFFHYQVLSRWEKFKLEITDHRAPEKIEELFPFSVFFNDVEDSLFYGRRFEEDLEIAEGCFRYIRDIFQQLEEFRAFELLRNGLDRTRYLLVKEAKIIAMTCTHAALQRENLVALGFKVWSFKSLLQYIADLIMVFIQPHEKGALFQTFPLQIRQRAPRRIRPNSRN